MNPFLRCLASLLLVLILPGCITINVYFPAEAAEKLAGKVIDVTRATAEPTGEFDGIPAVDAALRAMRGRHAKLVPLYERGAVGFTNNGDVALRDPAVLELPQRAEAISLIAAENQDRATVYREKAKVINQPDAESQLRATFAREYADKAEPGWYFQNDKGEWVRK
jgi:uncharacterized protein YdbL (DUF1318 family)